MQGANERGGSLLLFYYTSLLVLLAEPGPYKDALIYFRDKLEKQAEK
jgi:hypothetical protein